MRFLLRNIVLFTTVAAVQFPAEIFAAPACERRANNTQQKLLECVTLDGVNRHLQALQDIADANGGTRATGTIGFDESVDYVAGLLERAGYEVTIQPFLVNAFTEVSPAVLEQVAPSPTGPIPSNTMTYSGSGDVTSSVTVLPDAPGDLTPGCEAADFVGFPAGDIALIGRGTCSFNLKATNAYNAGATGVVFYNDEPGPFNGTLSPDFTPNIPVTAVTDVIGEQLAITPGLVLRLATDTIRNEWTSYNVLAETTSGDSNNVIMAGAHLDSVNQGPGIQDNGTGSAAILETALVMARVRPRNTVRFAWWGASEFGLVGSDHYVLGLSEEERANIALYLNFDQIGSPNYVRFVYDGDGSEFGLAGPDGSAAIESYFQGFYSARGLEFEATEISFRSDYAAFFDAGIPFGGIFTGAERIKTPEQQAIYGGIAGEQYDQCYHLACDTFDNVNQEVLELNADVAASAILHFSSVNMMLPRPIPPVCEMP